MFRPHAETFEEWLYSERSFRSLYGNDLGYDSEGEAAGLSARPGAPRKRRSRKSFFTPEDRYNSFFYRTYLSQEALDNGIRDDDSRLGKKFRRRFRVPFQVFVEICQDVEHLNGERAKVDNAGRETVPLELLVLACLRVLGSGCTFDAVEELTAVSEVTLRKFFHNEFCVWGVKASDTHVRMPETEDELRHVMRTYESRGFPGCVGSVDCVHLVWDKCPAGALSSCKGKGSFPSLAFQVVCDHDRRIQSVSHFFWGAVNDKTIAMCDEVSGDSISIHDILFLFAR